jgi:hypothetical protein
MTGSLLNRHTLHPTHRWVPSTPGALGKPARPTAGPQASSDPGPCGRAPWSDQALDYCVEQRTQPQPSVPTPKVTLACLCVRFRVDWSAPRRASQTRPASFAPVTPTLGPTKRRSDIVHRASTMHALPYDWDEPRCTMPRVLECRRVGRHGLAAAPRHRDLMLGLGPPYDLNSLSVSISSATTRASASAWTKCRRSQMRGEISALACRISACVGIRPSARPRRPCRAISGADPTERQALGCRTLWRSESVAGCVASMVRVRERPPCNWRMGL